MSNLFQSLSASMPYMEGPPPEFVHLDDKFICVHCRNLLRHPLQTICGHRICASCRDDVLGEDLAEFPCPAKENECQTISRESTYPDMALLREMTRLLAKCPYAQYGCTETTEWFKLQSHVNACEFASEPCPFCEEIILTRQQEHHKAECPQRPVKCEFCNEDVPFSEYNDHHTLHCPAAPMPCPYKCGEQSIIRGQLGEHKRVCAAKPKECRFKDTGCEFMGSDAEVAVHESSAPEHMDMLLTEIARLKRNLRDAESAKEEFENKMAEIIKENILLKKRVDYCEMKSNKIEMTIAPKIASIIGMEESVLEHSHTLSEQQRVLTAVQEVQQVQERKLAILERDGGGTGAGAAASPEILGQLKGLEKQMGQYNVGLSELTQRFQCLEQTSYDGTLMWRISDYKRRKADAVSGRTLSLYSQPFYSNRFGYKMCLRVYLNGDGMGKGTHMSLFFVVMRGDYDALLPWPFRNKVTLSLMDLDQRKRHLSDTFRPDPSSSSFQMPKSDMNIASGCPLFVAHSVLESATYLKNDTIFIKVSVDTDDGKNL